MLGSRLGLLDGSQGGGMMSGLVGEMHMLVLPSIPPLLTIILTLLTWMVSIL